MEPTATPTRKVGIGIGVVGAIVTILVGLGNEMGYTFSAEIQSALHTLISFGVAYFIVDKD